MNIYIKLLIHILILVLISKFLGGVSKVYRNQFKETFNLVLEIGKQFPTTNKIVVKYEELKTSYENAKKK